MAAHKNGASPHSATQLCAIAPLKMSWLQHVDTGDAKRTTRSAVARKAGARYARNQEKIKSCHCRQPLG
jgi:hypothetical protein